MSVPVPLHYYVLKLPCYISSFFNGIPFHVTAAPVTAATYKHLLKAGFIVRLSS